MRGRTASPARAPDLAKLVANLITRAGADRVLTVDLHAGQIQGFFDIPTDNLFAAPVLVRDIQDRLDLSNVMVVSPDVGGVVRARALAKRINAPLSIVDKRRERAGESEVMNIIGDVKGKNCILVDDIVDFGGTLCNAAEALLKEGATDVRAYITHGVLSGGAVARISASKLKELVVTDTIQATEAVRVSNNIRVISIAPLIGEAIARTAKEEASPACSTESGRFLSAKPDKLGYVAGVPFARRTAMTLENDLKNSIRAIPDYPKKGIMFRDITTLLGNAGCFRRAVDELVHPYSGKKIDQIAGMEARGFILGGAVAHQLSAGFIPIRKKGKLPHVTVSVAYSLEYGLDHMEMHEDAVKPGEKVLLVDDLIATGGTAAGAIFCCGRWARTWSRPASSSTCPNSEARRKSATSACPCGRWWNSPGIERKVVMARGARPPNLLRRVGSPDDGAKKAGKTPAFLLSCLFHPRGPREPSPRRCP